jgi:hypothetical protein
MVGFALPLGIFGAVELVFAIILLLPYPLHLPGVYVARGTRSEVGRTVLSTVSAFLLLLLLSPVYESIQLHKSEPPAGEGFAQVAERKGSEAQTNLSALLIGGTLVSMYVLRALGLALGEVADLKQQVTDLNPATDNGLAGKQPHGVLSGKASDQALDSQPVPVSKEE